MIRLALCGILICALLPHGMRAQSPPPPHDASGVWTENVVRHVEMKYLLVLPRNYNKQAGPWPVILYLHGAGDRGNDLALIRRTEAVRQAESRPDYPFILVAPQVSDLDQSWLYPENRDAAIHILDDVLKKYQGDRSRTYVTGISMGGWGAGSSPIVFRTASRRSRLCAAWMPISAGLLRLQKHPYGRSTAQMTR